MKSIYTLQKFGLAEGLELRREMESILFARGSFVSQNKNMEE